MKVYGFTTTPDGAWGATTGQVRVIVAARSKKAAVVALNEAGLGLSEHFFRTYGAESWNATEHEVALSSPGTVFWADEGGRPTHEDFNVVTR